MAGANVDTLTYVNICKKPVKRPRKRPYNLITNVEKALFNGPHRKGPGIAGNPECVRVGALVGGVR